MPRCADTTNLKPTVQDVPKPDAPPPELGDAARAAGGRSAAAPEQSEAAPPEPQQQADAKPSSTPPPIPAQPRLKPKPEAKEKFDVDSVLALLDKRTPKAAPPAETEQSDHPTPGIGAQNASTLDLQDALLAQMKQCWNVPVGAPNPEQLIVQLRVFLRPDGSLQQAEPEGASRNATGYMRVATEAALRAVNVCSPYKNFAGGQNTRHGVKSS